MRTALVAAVLVAAAAVAVFGKTVGFDYVPFDDDVYVSANLRVFAGMTRDNVRWAFETNYFSNWHPLTWLSYFLDVELFGPRPAGFHATNVLLHAIDSVLCYLWLRSLTGSDGRSAFVALLFAVHPLHVEPVAWISSRKDLLATGFALASGLAYVRYVRRGGAWTYWGAVAAFGLSLTAKQSALVFPFLLLLLDWWPLGRLSAGEPTATGSFRGRVLLDKLPFLALSVACGLAGIRAQATWGAVTSVENWPLPMRLANATVACEEYLRKALLPFDLCGFYPLHPDYLTDRAVLRAGLVLAAITTAALIAARRRPAWLVGWAWFVGMLAPAVGLVQLGQQRMADRYVYLPIVGLFVAVAWTLPEGLVQRRPLAWIVRLAAGGLVAAAAVVSYRQADSWRNGDAFAQRVCEVHHDQLPLLFQADIGRHMLRITRPADVAAHLRRELAAGRDNPLLHRELGQALVRLDLCEEAIPHLRVEDEGDSDSSRRLFPLMECLLKSGEYDEVVVVARKLLGIVPYHLDVLKRLVTALYLGGRYDEAAEVCRDMVRLAPADPAAWMHLRQALLAAGRAEEAAHVASEAPLEVPSYSTDFADAADADGRAALQAGRPDEAVSRFVEALWVAPANAPLHVNLAMAHLAKERTNPALFHLRRAVALDPRLLNARLALATVLRRTGDEAGAAEQFRRAAADHPGDPRIEQLRASFPAVRP